MFQLLKKTIVVIISFVISLTPLKPQPVQKCEPKFNGTFVQPWLTVTWDDERWQEEIAAMKEAGVEYLILQETADKSSQLSGDGSWEVYYPSYCQAFNGSYVGEDCVEAALRNCSGTGIKVFIGLAMFDDWWDLAAFGSQYKEVCNISAYMAEEMYNRYHSLYPDSFYGWYFVPEINNMPHVKLSINAVADGLNTILDKITQLDPNMPMLLSPYFTEYISVPSALATLPMWITFFERAELRDGDIFCPQDAIGAKWVSEKNLEKIWRMYSEAVKSCEADILLWANVENFIKPFADSDLAGIIKPQPTENTKMVPTTLDRLVWQMETASHYAENIITFSYSHYYSPANVSNIYHNTYVDYINNGFNLEAQVPSQPQEFKANKTEGGVDLSWNPSTDNFGISYYRLTRCGEFLARIEVHGEDILTAFTDTDIYGLSGEITYEVTAYDAAGNASQSSSVSIVI